MKKRYEIAGPYRTSDIKLATILITAGHALTGLKYQSINRDDKDRQQCRVLFEFECTEDLNDSILGYMSRALKVDACSLLDNYANLKSLVANANRLTLEEIKDKMKNGV